MTSKTKDLPFIPSEAKAFIVKEVVSSGTNGQSMTGKQWVTLSINTVEGDTDLASITNDQVTIQPGTYVLKGFTEQTGSTGTTIARLQDIDNAVTVFTGGSNIASSSNTSIPCEIYGVLEVSAATTYELQINRATGGTAGSPCSFGVDEVYVILIFIKI